MSRAPAILLAALLLAGAGWWGYERLVPGPDPVAPQAPAPAWPVLDERPAVPLAEAAHERRRQRIQDVVTQMRMGLSHTAKSQLVDVLDGFQRARLEFWARPEIRALDATAYESAYRALVAPHVEAARALLPDAEQADAVVRRFLFDGRIIAPP